MKGYRSSHHQNHISHKIKNFDIRCDADINLEMIARYRFKNISNFHLDDISKAFCTVCQKLLWQKIIYYNLKGKIYKIIKDYIDNKMQFVSNNETFIGMT